MSLKLKLETINEALQTIIYCLVLLCVFAMARFLWNIAEQTRVETEILQTEKGGKK